MRSTTNRNARGGAADRLRRRLWLLEMYGDGITAPCSLRSSPRCEETVTIETITVDRIIPGRDGGTYARTNIRVACAPCNYGEGGRAGAKIKSERREDGRSQVHR